MDSDRHLLTRGRGSRTSCGAVEQEGGCLVEAGGRGASLSKEALGLACPGGVGRGPARGPLSSAGRPELEGTKFPQLECGTARPLAYVNLTRSRANSETPLLHVVLVSEDSIAKCCEQQIYPVTVLEVESSESQCGQGVFSLRLQGGPPYVLRPWWCQPSSVLDVDALLPSLPLSHRVRACGPLF